MVGCCLGAAAIVWDSHKDRREARKKDIVFVRSLKIQCSNGAASRNKAAFMSVPSACV